MKKDFFCKLVDINKSIQSKINDEAKSLAYKKGITFKDSIDLLVLYSRNNRISLSEISHQDVVDSMEETANKKDIFILNEDSYIHKNMRIFNNIINCKKMNEFMKGKWFKN